MAILSYVHIQQKNLVLMICQKLLKRSMMKMINKLSQVVLSKVHGHYVVRDY